MILHFNINFAHRLRRTKVQILFPRVVQFVYVCINDVEVHVSHIAILFKTNIGRHFLTQQNFP